MVYTEGGVPFRSYLSSARWRPIIWALVMYPPVSSWECLSRSMRYKVVHIANVPHDHAGRGSSCWTAIRGSFLYRGRSRIGRLRVRKESSKALCNLDCMPGAGEGAVGPPEGPIGFNSPCGVIK
jgi:hypothetical protein